MVVPTLINAIDVISFQDNYQNPIEPTESTTFSLYGLTAFEVQYWNGSTWVTVPGGSVSGNNKVWKKFTFAPLTTTKIRVHITATSDNWSRMVEVEAWSASPGANIKWLVSDHLGTPRMIIDQTGTLANVKRHDYLPFGEEVFTPIGGRSTALGYASGDDVRQQFTLKERDVETGLDYFINRYYSSMQGRFTSPDAPFADQLEEEPQSWNLYSYVGNQPLNHTDPFGLWKQVDCSSGKGQCWESDNKNDTITSLAKILGVDASQLNKFLRNPKVKLGQSFDISGFWSWRAGITPGTEPAVVFVDLVDESEIPGDKYSVDVTIGPRFPIRNLSRQAAQKLWNEKGKIARLLTKEDNRLLREFFGQGTRGKLKDLKDFKIPQGLTKQALERYAEIARRAVESKNDKSGVQRDRLELIERALKTLKD